MMTVKNFLKSHDFRGYEYSEIHIYDRIGNSLTYEESQHKNVKNYYFYKDRDLEFHPLILLITIE